MTSVRFLNFGGLLNTGVSDFLLQNNELTAMKNVWMYKIGLLEKVPGYEKAEATQVVSGEDVDYLHYYYDTANKVDYLLGVADSGVNLTIKYRTTGAWSALSGISTNLNDMAGANVSMQNYLGRTFVVGYKLSSNIFITNATINGTAYAVSDSTNLTNMPQGKFVVEYRDLLYVLYAKTGGTPYPSRAYYSDDPVNGAITWNNLTTKFIEFGQDDGDEITGAVEALDRLVVFKRFSMWKYDESMRYKVAEIGCDSYRSIAIVGNVLYWFNRHGFYRWAGGQPELISSKANEYIDAIDATKLDEVVASVYYEGEYRAFIGNITLGDDTYNNAWFCWDTKKEQCYIRCTYHDIKSTCRYVEGGKRRMYFGDDNGYVYKFADKIDEVYSDDGNDIDSFFITKFLDHGVPEQTKFTNHITVFSNNCGGIKAAVAVDGHDNFVEASIPILEKNIESRDFAGSGNRYKYKFYERGQSKSWQFEGIVVETEISEHEE